MTGIEIVSFYTKARDVHLFWDNCEVYMQEDVLIECVCVRVCVCFWENERGKKSIMLHNYLPVYWKLD